MLQAGNGKDIPVILNWQLQIQIENKSAVLYKKQQSPQSRTTLIVPP